MYYYSSPHPLNKAISSPSFAPIALSGQPQPSRSKGRPIATKLTTPLSRPVNPWLALASLGLGAFMALLDTAIVNVTLSTMQQQLHTDLTTVSWTLHIYNLVFAVFLITAGRLGDLFGRKRCFLVGLLLFAAGSACCGLAPSIVWLLAARALQATGAAFLSAVSMALVHAVFPKEQRVFAMSLFGSLNALGIAAGPIVGGVLLPLFGWRSIFFVNLPFCLLAVLLVSRFVPEMRDPSSKQRFDLLGLITLSLALFCLVLAIIKGGEWGWTSVMTLSLLGWAVVGLFLFVSLESRHPAPLLDPHLFRSAGFSLSNLATLFYSMAIQSGNLFLTLYLLNVRGKTPLETAFFTLPIALSALLIPNTMSRLCRLLTPRLRCLLGVCLMALGLLLFCTLTAQVDYLDTLWRESIFGTGIGCCVGGFPVLALADIPADKLGAASGTINTFRQLGFVLGVALLIGFFSGQLQGQEQAAQATTITLVHSDTHLPIEVQNALLTHLFSSPQAAPPEPNDLVQIIADHPGWQASRGELTVLAAQVRASFETQAFHAYTSIWMLATSFPAVGIGLVIALLIISRRKKTQVSAWNTFYFFSLEGAITAQTLQRYLEAHQPSFLFPRAQQARRSVVQASLLVA